VHGLAFFPAGLFIAEKDWRRVPTGFGPRILNSRGFPLGHSGEIGSPTVQVAGSMNRIQLPQKWVDVLTSSPETGMGYQSVDLTLTDGRKLSGMRVYNYEVLALPEGSPVNPADIEEITVRERPRA